MLELTRRLGESLIIGDDKITVLNITRDQIYLDVNISESLTINLQESVTIRSGIVLTAVKIDKSQVKLGITAPESVAIKREGVPIEINKEDVSSSTFNIIDHTINRKESII